MHAVLGGREANLWGGSRGLTGTAPGMGFLKDSNIVSTGMVDDMILIDWMMIGWWVVCTAAIDLRVSTSFEVL
jgi:hypothetical protein